MGHGNNIRRGLLAFAALSGALGACDDKFVLVGTARESLHLDVCMGEETDCESEPETEPLVMPAPSACGSVVGPELQPDLEVDILSLLCPDDSAICAVAPRRFAVTSDGTIWVLGRVGGDPWSGGPLWLARISPDGELLDRIDASFGNPPPPENSVRLEVEMVVDERDHVFVLVYEMDGGPNADSPLVERSWLSEYDADGAVVREPKLITGIGAPRLAVGEGTLMIAANGTQNVRHGVLAAMDARQGELLWSQNGVRTRGQGEGYGVAGVATGAGGSWVLADRGTGANDNVIYGLTRYDEGGNAILDRALERSFWFARLFGVGDDVLIAATTLGHDTQGPESWFGRVDQAGEVIWAYDADVASGLGVGGLPVVVDEARGVALIATHSITGADLIEVSLDGERCVRHSVASYGMSYAAIDGEGNVYMTNLSSLIRVRLPEE